MSNSLSYELFTRQHPAYTAGYSQGFDVGVRSALDIICGELIRQDNTATVARLSDPHSQATRCHALAGSVLLSVAKRIAGRFRQQ